RAGPHDVVVANILAKPLMKMARAASQQMVPGGYIILSGLLRSQERMVLAAHQAQGRKLVRRIRRGNWSVLVLR
ncbi:50S ribosomal protein L11 methyltransferase, partial [Staphylococcus aureus]